MTERLYDRDPSLLVFDAKVLSCVPKDDRWLVELDRTAFFPEGGGQGADHGTLGDAQVMDAHDAKGTITHLVTAPLTPGDTVTGHVDAVRRLSMMQQHSGEHIFTGVVHTELGYENVGFHIGTDAVTVDFSGPLTPEQLRRFERLANEVIWRDQPIRAWIPSPDELAAMTYRSKKAIDGDVRIVEIEGVDRCACCGTHVAHTGQVGQIKIIGAINYKGGVRVSILCGMRALDYENALMEQNAAVSHALCAKPLETADAVRRLQEDNDALKKRAEQLGRTVFTAQAEKERGQRVRVIVGDMLDPGYARRAAGILADGAEFAVILLPRGSGWSYTLSSAVRDVHPAAKVLNDAFEGHGGGPKDMVQGVLASGTPEEIRAVLQAR